MNIPCRVLKQRRKKRKNSMSSSEDQTSVTESLGATSRECALVGSQNFTALKTATIAKATWRHQKCQQKRRKNMLITSRRSAAVESSGRGLAVPGLNGSPPLGPAPRQKRGRVGHTKILQFPTRWSQLFPPPDGGRPRGAHTHPPLENGRWKSMNLIRSASIRPGASL